MAVARDSRKHVPRTGLQPDRKPLSPSALALEQRLKQAGAEPPLDSELDPGELEALRAHGRAIRVSKSLHYHPDALAQIREQLVSPRGAATVAP